MAKRHMSLDLETTLSCESPSARNPISNDGWCNQSCDNGAKRTQSEMLSVASVPVGLPPLIRRDRRSQTVGCKRPMAIGLPRLNLSLINEMTMANRDVAMASANDLDQSPNFSPAGSRLLPPSTPFACGDFTPSSSTDNVSIPTGLASAIADQPTNILPFLFLGSQMDALSERVISANRIKYVINVSATSPQSPFVSATNFLRIPVNDSHTDRLLPFFGDAFQFLDSVRESSDCVLVHCLAGISRSPTLVIAYVMHHLGMTTDQAYRYVKDRRPSISPNFNFLGQLVEYESQIRKGESCLPQIESSTISIPRSCEVQVCPSTPCSSDVSVNAGPASDDCLIRSPSPVKRPCFINVSRSSSTSVLQNQQLVTTSESSSRSPALQNLIETSANLLVLSGSDSVVAQSPTTAMSKLNFELQVVGGGVNAVLCRNGNRSKNARVVSVPALSSSQSPCYPDNIVVSSPLHEQPRRLNPSLSSSTSGAADLVGASLNALPRRENHQIIAWTPTSRIPFAVLCGCADMEPVTTHRVMTEGHHDLLWQHVQQATMKSRSFEDILMLSKDAAGGSAADLSTTSGWMSHVRQSAADLCADDDIQSGSDGTVTSSLSGRGGSLHGSLEMIQVS